MAEAHAKPYRDKDWLIEHYHRRRMSFSQVADEAGVAIATIQRWMDKHNIESRSRGTQLSREVSLVEDSRGYERWYNSHNGETSTCYVHQLLAIAKGNDPHEVFGGESETHHLNGIKWDNRPENVVLLSRNDHQEIHRDDYVSPWE